MERNNTYEKKAFKKWEEEQSKLHGNQCSQMSRSERNSEQHRPLVFQRIECDKTFKSITGRKNHEKIHRKNR